MCKVKAVCSARFSREEPRLEERFTDDTLEVTLAMLSTDAPHRERFLVRLLSLTEKSELVAKGMCLIFRKQPNSSRRFSQAIHSESSTCSHWNSKTIHY